MIQIYKDEMVLGGDTIRYSHPAEIEGQAEKIISRMNGMNWRSLCLDDRSMEFYQKYFSVMASTSL